MTEIVTRFLGVLETHFRVPKIDLFQPKDLVMADNVIKVFNCLRTWALLLHAQRNFEPQLQPETGSRVSFSTGQLNRAAARLNRLDLSPSARKTDMKSTRRIPSFLLQGSAKQTLVASIETAILVEETKAKIESATDNNQLPQQIVWKRAEPTR
jgi:hypothetical protein